MRARLPILERLRNLLACDDCFSFVMPRLSFFRRARRLRAPADRSRPRRREAGRQGARRPPLSSRPPHPFRRRRAPNRRPRFSPPPGKIKSRLKKMSGFTTRASRRFSTARGRLATHANGVGLVGHNPGLGELATALAARAPGDTASPQKYPTGAVAVLDFSIQRWEDIEPHSGMLALYLTPAELDADAE